MRKPMLAVAMKSPDDISYPCYASPKLDGIRCLIHPELGPVSRRFKPIPNDHIRKLLDTFDLHGLDGELVTYNEDGSMRTFNEIQGDVMRKDGQPKFLLLVFDDFTDDKLPFEQRVLSAKRRAERDPWTSFVPHAIVDGPDALREVNAVHMDAGFEGTMTRHPAGLYKSGRSTLKQEWLLKLKEFADAEGTVTAVEERLHNTNPQERDETGQSKRSSAKSGLVGAGTAGALVLATEWGELRVGTGFDDRQRDEIWRDREQVVGRLVTFSYQPSGMQDAPRFPVFKGFRDRRDT